MVSTGRLDGDEDIRRLLDLHTHRCRMGAGISVTYLLKKYGSGETVTPWNYNCQGGSFDFQTVVGGRVAISHGDERMIMQCCFWGGHAVHRVMGVNENYVLFTSDMVPFSF